MTAAGLGLNKFCYAGLIAAHKNKIPTSEDAASKVPIKYLMCPLFYLFNYVTGCDFSLLRKRLLSLFSSPKGGLQLKHQETVLKML